MQRQEGRSRGFSFATLAVMDPSPLGRVYLGKDVHARNRWIFDCDTTGGNRNETVKYYGMLLWTLAEVVGAVGAVGASIAKSGDAAIPLRSTASALPTSV